MSEHKHGFVTGGGKFIESVLEECPQCNQAEITKLRAELEALRFELALAKAGEKRADKLMVQAEAELEALKEAQRWIPVGERLPETRQRVVIQAKTREGRTYIETADYIAPRTVLSEDYLSDDCDLDFSDYDEEQDCYWTPTGWWEYQEAPEMNYYITDTVTYWRPLPAVPKEEG